MFQAIKGFSCSIRFISISRPPRVFNLPSTVPEKVNLKVGRHVCGRRFKFLRVVGCK